MSSGDGDLRVLLVDDASDYRMLLRRVLEQTGRYVVVGEADDGVEGIEVAAELQPDLVLLDLSMPRMDGMEALPRILEVSPQAVVVVLSGYGDRSAAGPAVQLGAAAYLEKGSSIDELVAALDSAAARADADDRAGTA